ncbi:MAG: flagellar motor switch protein FliN [Treponemataceae bacterium]|nr:flagellar motor switch protein FliN [Treponemataceae bacterium]
MSDGAISQEEIDALLAGVDMGGINTTGISSPASSANLDLSYLKDIAGKNSEALASSLETMTGAQVKVDEAVIETVGRDQVLRKIPEMVVSITADFNEGLYGSHLFILAPELTQKLAGLINKEDAPEIDGMSLSVVSEVVSQHTGNEITNISNTGKFPGLACNPAEANHVPKAMVHFPQGSFVLFSYPLTVDGSVYTLWEIMGEEVAKSLIVAFGGGQQETPKTDNSFAQMSSPAAAQPQMAGMQQQMGGMPMGGMQMGMPQMGMPMGGMQQMPMGGMQMGMPQMGMPMGMQMPMNTPNVQSVQYPMLQNGAVGMEQGNIGLIMDVFMEMTVELGRTKKLIKDILGMGEGTIIELDKLAGEPVDILVNHKPIAKGEVVVIDENFGVRVTEILSPMERLADSQ